MATPVSPRHCPNTRLYAADRVWAESMNPEKRAKLMVAVLASFAIGGAIAFGVAERLNDPLSTSGVAAEDPYTHMILVRGHIRDGNLDAVFPGGTLYPPGMHAVLATTWVYTGLDLYDIFRVGPVVFGAIGILGIGIFVSRHAGLLAGSVAALATALAPEMIFRTTMMAPTAVDLALVPFLLAAGAETLRGHRTWGVATGAMLVFLVVSHPWMIAILGPLVLGWVLVGILGVSWQGKSVRIDPIGAVILLAVTGLSLIAAVTICWDECGLGFQDLVVARMEATLDRVSLFVGMACVAVAAALFALRHQVDKAQAAMAEKKMPLVLRLAISGVLAVGLVLGTFPAVKAGMPEFVDLPRMYGWVLLGLAALATACLPFLKGRAALPLVGLAVITYPFVIYNPLDSPFWPHRTAAYLGIALVALAGIGAAAIVRVLQLGAEAWAKRAATRQRRGAATMAKSRIWSMGAIATLVGATVMAGTVYAATPLEYEEGWYRLYPDCEFEQLRRIAEDAEPGTVIVAGSWQAKLVMGAFSDDGMDVWFSYEMFTRGDRRANTITGLGLEDRDFIMVTDRYLRTEQPRFDNSFLSEEPFEPLGSWCGDGLQSARMSASIVRAVA